MKQPSRARPPKATRRSRAEPHSNDKLRRLVAEGRASGEPVDGESALRRLRAKFAAMGASKFVADRYGKR